MRNKVDPVKFSDKAYDKLLSNPLTTRQTITNKFFFVQGFKAGIVAMLKATPVERDELLAFMNNGFFFADPTEDEGAK